MSDPEPGTGSPRRRAIVGLDVGTTGTKAVAFVLGAGTRHIAVREYPLLQPAPGQQVQDVDAVAEGALAALGDCLPAVGDADVLAVSVSTAMHGLVGLDERMHPVTPLLTWADARAAGQAARLRADGTAATLHRRSGTPVHPMSPLTKLLWFHEEEPETAAGVRWWAGLKDYLLWRLTGDLVTELSSASGTGLLDLDTRTWDPDTVALTGASPDQLPRIVPTTAVLTMSPETAARVGLPAGTRVVAGAGDGPLGNLGTGAIAPGVAGLSLGTSGALRLVVAAPYVASEALFCYALTDDAWVVGGAVSNGGIVTRWAADALVPDLVADVDEASRAAGEDDERVLALAEEAPPGCDGLVMLPYLLAERAPLWEPALPGAYLGVHRAHRREHFVRAAVEGVCRQLWTVLQELERVQHVDVVTATGRTFASDLWRNVMAATLDRPLAVVGDAEGTAVGAAALGLLALGEAADLTAALLLLGDPRDTAETVRPDATLVGVYEAARRSVPGLVARLGPVAALFAAD